MLHGVISQKQYYYTSALFVQHLMKLVLCTPKIRQDAGKWFKTCFTFRTPRGLEDVSMYPELFAELLRSGHWTVGDLKKVAGLNLLRVFAKVEKVNCLCDKHLLCLFTCLFVECVTGCVLYYETEF